MQGPDESVSKLFLVESEGEGSHEGVIIIIKNVPLEITVCWIKLTVSWFPFLVSAAVAQFLRLSDFELQSILRLYCEEEEREVQSIKNKYGIFLSLQTTCHLIFSFTNTFSLLP